ncbi:MFS transporter [Micromonospora sp. NPDC049900]|uniref:MFS transporter n=1 Tax=Micromonospora sp. NPDC049900 TaxID=3364275 RepID=UPI0037B8D752
MPSTGALASRVGNEMAGTAVLLFAFAESSRGEGAAVFGLLAVAAAVGGPLLGVWIDRGRSAAPLTLSLVAFTLGLVAIGASMHAGQDHLTMVLAVATGLFGPAVAGGWSASLTSSDPQKARRLVVFDASSYSVAGLVGPALAGVAYAVGGRAAPLALTVALLAIGSMCAPWAHPGPTPSDAVAAVDARTSRPHPLSDLRSGMLAIVRQPRLRWATTSSCIAFFGFGIFAVMVPSIGAARFGSPAAGSLILSVLAGAALVSNAVLARRDGLGRPAAVLTASTAAIATGIAMLLINNPAATLVAAVIVGAGDGPQLASLLHIRHAEAPQRLRTQIFTTGASLKITASGLGALAAVPLMHHGMATAIVTAAVAHLAGAGVAVMARDNTPATPFARLLGQAR